MDYLYNFFKSAMDEDKSAVVMCNLEHKIVYMNPAACEHYAKYGGEKLFGKNLLECHNPKSREMIEKVIAWFEKSKSNNRIYTYYSEKENKDVYMIALRDENGELIGYYEKHEYRSRENGKMYDFG